MAHELRYHGKGSGSEKSADSQVRRQAGLSHAEYTLSLLSPGICLVPSRIPSRAVRHDLEGRTWPAITLGQLAAPNHAHGDVGVLAGFNGIAATTLAGVEPRPVFVVAAAALRCGVVASFELPMAEVDDLEVIGQAHTANVWDLQAVVTVMNQPAQRLRAFAGQHTVPSDELALVER